MKCEDTLCLPWQSCGMPLHGLLAPSRRSVWKKQKPPAAPLHMPARQFLELCGNKRLSFSRQAEFVSRGFLLHYTVKKLHAQQAVAIEVWPAAMDSSSSKPSTTSAAPRRLQSTDERHRDSASQRNVFMLAN